MSEWKCSGELLRQNETITEYKNGGKYSIEKRVVHIPDVAPEIGGHVEFFVVEDGQDIKQCIALRQAKMAVEEYEKMDEIRRKIETGEMVLNFASEEGSDQDECVEF